MKGDTLSEQQEALLEDILSGTPWRKAIDRHGYSSHTQKSRILKSPIFKKELASRLESMIAINGPSALKAMEDIMINPTEPGNKEKLKVATEFLDRSGLGKIERVRHEGEAVSALFVLPQKAAPLKKDD